MRLELAGRQREAQLAELRRALDAAYEDIARLDGSGDPEAAAACVQVVNGCEIFVNSLFKNLILRSMNICIAKLLVAWTKGGEKFSLEEFG